MPEIAELPTIKLAKVGAARERKKPGLLVSLGGGKAGGSLTGKLAGGYFSLFSTTAGKVAMALAVSAMGGGAYQAGKSLAPADIEASAKPKAFADAKAEKKRKYEGDLSKVASTEKSKDDSLGMVSGSFDGKTPEERAAEAAAAEAAAKAAAQKEAQASATPAEQPAAGGAPAGGVPGAGGMDPAAMMAAAGGGQAAGAGPGTGKDNKGAFASRFGNMASSLGGGGSGASLAGGGGLAGGVGRSFSKPELGGSLRGFKGGSAPGRQAASVARVPKGTSRSFAANQLTAANRLSQAARSGSAENRAANASAAFDNNPGGNTALTGGGAGAGARPAGSGTADAAGGTNPGGGSGPTNPGDSFEPEPDECANGQINSSAGGCVDPPQVGKGKDSSPWKIFTQIAMALFTIGSIILFIAGILGDIGKGVVTASATEAAVVLGAIGAVIGAIVLLLGIVITAFGQTLQGIITTVLGAFLGTMGAIVAFGGAAVFKAGGTSVTATVSILGGFFGTFIGIGGAATGFD